MDEEYSDDEFLEGVNINENLSPEKREILKSFLLTQKESLLANLVS